MWQVIVAAEHIPRGVDTIAISASTLLTFATPARSVRRLSIIDASSRDTLDARHVRTPAST